MREDYARQYKSLFLHHWWWRARERLVMFYVHRVASGRVDLQILDVGCGDAFLFDKLSWFGEVWGVEPDANLVSPTNPWRSRISIGPFGAEFQPERAYDLLLMLDVLEHIEDEAGALRKAHELLAPSGRLLITVPALPWLWSAHDEANRHYRRYTRKSLLRLLEAAGLGVVRTHYFFGWPVVPLLARRFLFPAGSGRGLQPSEYSVRIPWRAVNSVLYGASVLEHQLALAGAVPLGSSLLAVTSPAA